VTCRRGASRNEAGVPTSLPVAIPKLCLTRPSDVPEPPPPESSGTTNTHPTHILSRHNAREFMVDSASLATFVLLACASALLLAAMLYPAAMLRWFQRKRYQYEVTFSLYMLTSTEKFIFSTCSLAHWWRGAIAAHETVLTFRSLQTQSCSSCSPSS
jgi:hypothetical protein